VKSNENVAEGLKQPVSEVATPVKEVEPPLSAKPKSRKTTAGSKTVSSSKSQSKDPSPQTSNTNLDSTQIPESGLGKIKNINYDF
jgi:hypothetical protein